MLTVFFITASTHHCSWYSSSFHFLDDTDIIVIIVILQYYNISIYLQRASVKQLTIHTRQKKYFQHTVNFHHGTNFSKPYCQVWYLDTSPPSFKCVCKCAVLKWLTRIHMPHSHVDSSVMLERTIPQTHTYTTFVLYTWIT